MSTWLMDTPLFKMLATPKAKPLLEWCEANDASLFLSAASLAHVARGIDKLPTSQSQRAKALRIWLDKIIDRFGHRIHQEVHESRSGFRVWRTRRNYRRLAGSSPSAPALAT